ncbi:MAG: hypothetical protein JXR37_23965 [Kiritimatiellae bacterium]|nr:hypothetical protein [Kiritimatiellia bacterium]
MHANIRQQARERGDRGQAQIAAKTMPEMTNLILHEFKTLRHREPVMQPAVAGVRSSR